MHIDLLVSSVFVETGLSFISLTNAENRHLKSKFTRTAFHSLCHVKPLNAKNHSALGVAERIHSMQTH